MQCRQMDVVVKDEVRPPQSGKISPNSHDCEAQKAWKGWRMLPDCYVSVIPKSGHNVLRDHTDAAVMRA